MRKTKIEKACEKAGIDFFELQCALYNIEVEKTPDFDGNGNGWFSVLIDGVNYGGGNMEGDIRPTLEEALAVAQEDEKKI